MSDNEFEIFTVRFRKAFMRGDEEFSFLPMWKSKLLPFDLADLEAAILEIAADPRIADKSHPVSFVRNRLPILIEHAESIRRRRREDAEMKELFRQRDQHAKGRK